MVKVTFMPWTEIVIHEVIGYESPEALIEQRIAGVPKGIPIGPLFWINGIVFTKAVMPATADVIREQMKGIVHYQSIEYAPMEKFVNSVTTQSGIAIPIIDVSRTEALRDVVAALKARK